MHRYLFEVIHPKHFHQFQILAHSLTPKNEVLFIARDKDVSLELMKSSNLPYQTYSLHGDTLWQKTLYTPLILKNYLQILYHYRPHFIISRASPYAAIVSRITKTKTIIMPDSEVVILTKKLVAPLAQLVITPSNYTLDHGNKHHRVNGLFEETYLHPQSFQPNQNVKSELGIAENTRYFVLRFVGWNAHHDIQQHGFREQEKRTLVEYLQQYGKVFISSERPISSDLASYQLYLPAHQIHSVLHYAVLYVGDSQTMSTEASLLGTPSLRYNSFVGDGDMSNFIVLEEKHHLLRNAQNFDDVMNILPSLLEPNAKQQWLQKRDQYFKNKPHINQEILNLVEAFSRE